MNREKNHYTVNEIEYMLSEQLGERYVLIQSTPINQTGFNHLDADGTIGRFVPFNNKYVKKFLKQKEEAKHQADYLNRSIDTKLAEKLSELEEKKGIALYLMFQNNITKSYEYRFNDNPNVSVVKLVSPMQPQEIDKENHLFEFLGTLNIGSALPQEL